MSSKEMNDITNIIKVMEQSFDLRVQFIQSIKDIIKKNNIVGDDAYAILQAVAIMNEEQIAGLSQYAEAVDFVFPDV